MVASPTALEVEFQCPPLYLPIRIATVRAENITCAIFLAADSPKTSLQISVHAGRINSSPVVNGLLILAMR